MANRPTHLERARTRLRWHHALLAAVALIGVVALVANLFGA